MIIGAHVSIAGGISKAPSRAADIGAQCVQTFASSPRGWQPPSISDSEVSLYLSEAERCGVHPLFFHAIYLVNLASDKKDLRKKSIESVVEYLKTSARMKGAGVIVHVGSHGGSGLQGGIRRVAEAIKLILAATPRSSRLCLENTAGGGDTIGRNVQELGSIIKKVRSKRLFVCLDTAHAFASGYDITSKKGVEDFAQAFKKEVGTDRLLAMHANDSKTPLSSNADRHENIGEGHLGMKSFKHLARNTFFSSVPWILEVPGNDGKGPDSENVDRIRSLQGE